MATITIDGGALTTPMTVMVQPNSLLVQKLPWQQALKMCNEQDTPEVAGCNGATVPEPGIVAKGAYHLRSDQPITVYQFNSLEYTTLINGVTAFSFTNDASLMLPTNVWRSSYFTASWQSLSASGYPSEVAVTAAHDGTMVTINSRAATAASTGISAFVPGTPQRSCSTPAMSSS